MAMPITKNSHVNIIRITSLYEEVVSSTILTAGGHLSYVVRFISGCRTQLHSALWLTLKWVIPHHITFLAFLQRHSDLFLICRFVHTYYVVYSNMQLLVSGSFLTMSAKCKTNRTRLFQQHMSVNVMWHEPNVNVVYQLKFHTMCSKHSVCLINMDLYIYHG